MAGILSDRIGSRPLMTAGLSLQSLALAYLALVTATDVPYAALVPGFAMAGTGMALVFAPSANALLSSVRQSEAGQASGVNSWVLPRSCTDAVLSRRRTSLIADVRR